MKYYVISIQHINDGTTPCSIFVYDTEDAARMAFHQTLASDYANSNLTGFLVQLIDDSGVIINTENGGNVNDN